MANPVIASNAKRAGLRLEFLRTYFPKYDGLKAELEKIGQVGLPSDKDIEYYFHWTSAPQIKRWVRGTQVSSKAFRGVQYTATNYEWARAVDWFFADEQDDQTKSLPEAVRRMADSAAQIDERVFFQILQNSTDADLLETIPTAPDGQNLFSTTYDGSNARFGATNGNSLTGTGVAASSTIETDFFSAAEQFRLYQDTEGQPLWDRGTLDGGFIIFHAASGTLAKLFANVFQQGVTHSTIAGTSTTNVTTGAGVSNVIMDRGHKVQLVPTQRISGNSWYIALAKAPQKALFSQERMKPQEWFEAWDNSDIVRRTGYKSFGAIMRRGYGVAEPYQIIKVTNT